MTYKERDAYMIHLKEALTERIRGKGDFKIRGNTYIYSGTNTAINRGEQIPVNYICNRLWYGLIVSWQYVEIDVDKAGTILPFVSVPFFVSRKDNSKMIPVFRAEWDSYPQKSNCHPQAHWHFTQAQTIYDELDPDFDIEYNDWNSLIMEEHKKIIDEMPLNRMHFAMSERWADGGDMIAGIPGPRELAIWIYKLLHHVETEIRYVMDE